MSASDPRGILCDAPAAKALRSQKCGSRFVRCQIFGANEGRGRRLWNRGLGVTGRTTRTFRFAWRRVQVGVGIWEDKGTGVGMLGIPEMSCARAAAGGRRVYCLLSCRRSLSCLSRHAISKPLPHIDSPSSPPSPPSPDDDRHDARVSVRSAPLDPHSGDKGSSGTVINFN